MKDPPCRKGLYIPMNIFKNKMDFSDQPERLVVKSSTSFESISEICSVNNSCMLDVGYITTVGVLNYLFSKVSFPSFSI